MYSSAICTGASRHRPAFAIHPTDFRGAKHSDCRNRLQFLEYYSERFDGPGTPAHSFANHK